MPAEGDYGAVASDATSHHSRDSDGLVFEWELLLSNLRGDMIYSLEKDQVQRAEIGVWQVQWSQVSVANRSADYFQNYDSNIRCWIPDYDLFIRTCADIINQELADLVCNKQGKSVKLLEVGFGTGALTKPIIALINQWSGPSSTGREEAAIQYFGLDEAWPRMRPHFRRRIPGTSNHHRFVRGSAWDSLPRAFESAKPFDLICGSLVLHDLIYGSPEEGFARALAQCDRYLGKGGRLVFADVFTADDREMRQEQRAKWKYWMVEQGLTQEQAEFFLSENPEMVETVTAASLRRCSSSLGYTLELRHVGREWSPFQILLMRKEGGQSQRTPK